MPRSSRQGKDKILEWVSEIQPTYSKILDIGAGSGTYAKFYKKCRNLENVEWTGIEVWKPYIDKYKLENRYDIIRHEDVRVANLTERYDIVFCGDVLEHMSKEQAVSLVRKLQKHCSMIIISIPIIYYEQEALGGNEYEVHIEPDWNHEKVINTFEDIVDSETYSVIGIYKVKGYL